MAGTYKQAPFRAVRFGPAETVVEKRADGAMILKSPRALGRYARCVTEPLLHWARERAEQAFLAERAPGGAGRRITYAATLARVRSIGTALLARGLSAERPLVVLSGNDIEHGLLALGAMHVGIPVAPISVPYSLVS